MRKPLALACLALLGCSSGRAKLTALGDVSADEAVAILRVRIVCGGKDRTEGSIVVFNTEPRSPLIPDQGGYIFAKLPIGTSSLEAAIVNLGLFSLTHQFPEGQMTVVMNKSGVIYYIGDLTLDWRPEDMPLVATGTFGMIIIAKKGELGGSVVASVQSNEAAAREAFQKAFPGQHQIVTSLIVPKPAP